MAAMLHEKLAKPLQVVGPDADRRQSCEQPSEAWMLEKPSVADTWTVLAAIETGHAICERTGPAAEVRRPKLPATDQRQTGIRVRAIRASPPQTDGSMSIPGTIPPT